MDCINPQGNGFQNYVWDTQALNQLASDDDMIILCKSAYDVGHRYYITTVQERELVGVPDRTMKYNSSSAWRNPQGQTFEVMKSLCFCRISCIALLYLNFWLLDGSMRILEDSGPRIDMFNEIYNNNNHHKRDATIAEATVYHNCFLISNDKRLRNKTNKYFPGTAITYKEYKDRILALIAKEANARAD